MLEICYSIWALVPLFHASSTESLAFLVAPQRVLQIISKHPLAVMAAEMLFVPSCFTGL